MEKTDKNILEEQEFIHKYVKTSDKTYNICKAILKPFALLLYRPTIINKEFIPEKDGILLAGNHRSIVDPALVCLSCDRAVRYLAKKELHEGIFGFFFRAAQTIPVDRSRKDNNATSAALEVLRHGDVVGIFPEGKRNKTEEPLLPLKYGAVSMAQKTGAKIVPFAISGSFIPFKGDMKIEFGQPFEVKKEDNLTDANQYLHDQIIELINRGKTL